MKEPIDSYEDEVNVLEITICFGKLLIGTLNRVYFKLSF